jgi:hypothetical protein
MHKHIVRLLVATVVGSAAAIAVASPAHAEPCGASSWKEAPLTQSVAYRSCAPSGNTRLKGWIKGGPFGLQTGPCVTIPAGGSKYLMNNQPTYETTLLPWGVKSC